MEVPENVTVEEYFDTYVPKLFEEQMGGKVIPGMEDTEFTVQFTVGGTVRSIVVKDAKELIVKPEALDNPMMAVEISEEVWRAAITGKLPGSEMFTELGQVANRRMYDAVKGVRGTMKLELTDPDATIKVTFNGAASPEATFKTNAETWAEMQAGTLAGPMAFMQGKLKIEGDMAFAMSLNTLVSA